MTDVTEIAGQAKEFLEGPRFRLVTVSFTIVCLVAAIWPTWVLWDIVTQLVALLSEAKVPPP